jgi:hypothetical protein
VDETYVRVGGKWKYLFRAVDKHGHLIDFMLSDRRNTKAARRFLAKALKVMRNWPPVALQYAIQLRSVYAIRIYELLKQYQRLKQRTLAVAELRRMLAIDEHKYTLIKDFRRRVIDIAQREINAKTDLCFEYDPIKTGRKITHFRLADRRQSRADLFATLGAGAGSAAPLLFGLRNDRGLRPVVVANSLHQPGGGIGDRAAALPPPLQLGEVPGDPLRFVARSQPARLGRGNPVCFEAAHQLGPFRVVGDRRRWDRHIGGNAEAVDHHRQACFLSEGPAPAETRGRAERHRPAPDVEVP